MDKGRQAEKILKALANRRRLAIVKYLCRTKRSTPTKISEEIKLSFKATSKHLGILFAAELVEREQYGLRIDYFLAEPFHRIVKATLESL
jgi:DNA-binding transcriptional ArsR family regulator